MPGQDWDLLITRLTREQKEPTDGGGEVTVVLKAVDIGFIQKGQISPIANFICDPEGVNEWSHILGAETPASLEGEIDRINKGMTDKGQARFQRGVALAKFTQRQIIPKIAA